jgi:hypothetical protein
VAKLVIFGQDTLKQAFSNIRCEYLSLYFREDKGENFLNSADERHSSKIENP